MLKVLQTKKRKRKQQKTFFFVAIFQTYFYSGKKLENGTENVPLELVLFITVYHILTFPAWITILEDSVI